MWVGASRDSEGHLSLVQGSSSHPQSKALQCQAMTLPGAPLCRALLDALDRTSGSDVTMRRGGRDPSSWLRVQGEMDPVAGAVRQGGPMSSL